MNRLDFEKDPMWLLQSLIPWLDYPNKKWCGFCKHSVIRKGLICATTLVGHPCVPIIHCGIKSCPHDVTSYTYFIQMYGCGSFEPEWEFEEFYNHERVFTHCKNCNVRVCPFKEFKENCDHNGCTFAQIIKDLGF